MSAATDHPAPNLIACCRGERYWWVAADGTLMVRARAAAPAMVAIASGRVYDDASIGVIERFGERDATLGLLSVGLVELLARRFPGVRWAVADVPARVPGRRPITEPATA